jgi:hypothetical protein
MKSGLRVVLPALMVVLLQAQMPSVQAQTGTSPTSDQLAMTHVDEMLCAVDLTCKSEAVAVAVTEKAPEHKSHKKKLFRALMAVGAVAVPLAVGTAIGGGGCGVGIRIGCP